MRNTTNLFKVNSNRKNSSIVIGRGNPKSNLMLIGEAPGATEEKLASPFVGRSGTVLNGLLQSVGIDPEKDVFITNVVKCRPPQNRRPNKAKVILSLQWLMQQIVLVKEFSHQKN